MSAVSTIDFIKQARMLKLGLVVPPHTATFMKIFRMSIPTVAPNSLAPVRAHINNLIVSSRGERRLSLDQRGLWISLARFTQQCELSNFCFFLEHLLSSF